MDVIYEDNHLLVVDKPAGIPTQPNDSGSQNLEEMAKAYLKRPYLHAVHRLDKPVRGLVLFAKTSKALSRLNAAMRAGKFEKIYYARVDPLPKKESGTLIHYLIRGEQKTEVVSKDVKGSKEARLHFRILEENLLEIRLDTGRKHQIRAQLAAIGSPIIGDSKYGSSLSGNGIELYAAKLAFPHPITGETIRCQLSL